MGLSLVLVVSLPLWNRRRYGGLFFGPSYLGITIGRAMSGFLTLRLTDTQMVRLGRGVSLSGIAALLLPPGGSAALFPVYLLAALCLMSVMYLGLLHRGGRENAASSTAG